VERLEARKAHLQARRFAALHFRGPGTDLTVGLADGHVWMGGSVTGKAGVPMVPNLPTDEVFTAPHRERVNGTVRASKPLSARGDLIDGIEVRFENGVVVDATARTGEATLRQLLGTDDGARRLGEVALVPASAPVARTGLLFLNTLFDENAASHIALGRAYPPSAPGGEASGRNDSLVHVDWMVGSPETDVDGVTASGDREALMRGGEWAF
jgi:aminopeptidase